MPETKKPARFPCPGCSGDMDFDPASGQMKCRFCGTLAPVSPDTAPLAPPHGYEEFLNKTDDTHLRPISDQALQVNCDGCGSVVVFQPPEVAGVCPFCAATIVAQPKATDPLIAPDALLPAKIAKTNAQAEVRQWLQSRWFAPNALKRMAREEGIGGIYLPFWDYAADTASRYTGARGDTYYETEYDTETDEQGNNVQKSRQVPRIRWTAVSGEVSRDFDKLLIPATTSVNEHRLDALEPWDIESLCAYTPAYLAGFKAQRYQLELPKGYEKAKEVMQAEIEGDVRRDIGGDQQQINGIDTTYSNVTFRHLLLPVWIGAYRFRDKAYQVIVNARTGEVQGERPYSTAKITFLVIGIIVIIVIIAMLAHR
jgi:ribosomal protein S27E